MQFALLDDCSNEPIDTFTVQQAKFSEMNLRVLHLKSMSLSALAGALYASQELPGNAALFSLLSLIPLLTAISQVARNTSTHVLWGALPGWVFGVMASIVGAWWLPNAFYTIGELTWNQSILASIVTICLVNSLPFAIFGVLICALLRRHKLDPTIVAFVWIITEYINIYGLIPNPYMMLGLSLAWTPFAQIVDIIGPHGLGACIAGTMTVVTSVLIKRSVDKADILAGCIVFIATICFLAYSNWQYSNEFVDKRRALQVALVSVDAPLLPITESVELSKKVASNGVQIVIWPENSIDFDLSRPSFKQELFKELTSDLQAEMLVGAPYFLGINVFASVYAWNHGEITYRFDKMRLVPFVEYSPLGRWIGPDRLPYSAGDRANVIISSGYKIGAYLCGESFFPAVPRLLTRGGAEILVNPSSDRWLPKILRRHTLKMASFRAIENRRYVVRPTKGGVSAVIDPYGRIIKEQTGPSLHSLEATIHPGNTTTVYQEYGEIMPLTIIILIITIKVFLYYRTALIRMSS